MVFTLTFKRRSILTGFPWVSAITLYTLSWGWSLLRPNTLYWDDWAVIFRKPKFFMLRYVRTVGRPPWSDVLETFLIPLGVWTVQLGTFFIFFVCGFLLFEILKRVQYLDISQVRWITLLFLIIPVNHARISLVVFDYSTSYLLFFLGWLALVRYHSFVSFSFSWLILLLSLKTHSLLFFLLLPFLHFVWLERKQLLKFKRVNLVHIQTGLIAIMPFLYLILREFFWPPSKSWINYQRPTVKGTILGAQLFIPVASATLVYLFWRKNKVRSNRNFVIFLFGIGITALGLFPYFAAGLLRNYISLIAIRSDWGSRHLLLTPLGIATAVVGLNGIIAVSQKNLILKICVIFSLIFNLYFGSTYYLDSVKKDELIVLLTSQENLAKDVQFVVIDESKRFNGRGALYRDYEWSALFSLAGMKPRDVSAKRLCDEQPSAIQLTLKSNTPYLKALVTRSLGLYLEVKPCSEVLAESG